MNPLNSWPARDPLVPFQFHRTWPRLGSDTEVMPHTYRIRLEIERSDGASSSVEMDHIPAEEAPSVIDIAHQILAKLESRVLPDSPVPQPAPDQP